MCGGAVVIGLERVRVRAPYRAAPGKGVVCRGSGGGDGGRGGGQGGGGGAPGRARARQSGRSRNMEPPGAAPPPPGTRPLVRPDETGEVDTSRCDTILQDKQLCT